MNEPSPIASGLSAFDERAIAAILVGYACAIDQRDWHKLRKCFSDDCEADYGHFGNWKSGAAITAFMKKAHNDIGPSLHRISNIEIRVEMDRVCARSYVDALLMPVHAGGPVHRGIGYYDDQFVRTGDGWRISRRQFTAVLTD